MAPKVTLPFVGSKPVFTAQVKTVSSTSVMVVDSVAWPSSGTVIDVGPVTSGGSLMGFTVMDTVAAGSLTAPLPSSAV